MLRPKFGSMTSSVTRVRMFTMRSSAVAIGLVMVMVLSGCAVGPKYQRPAAPVPTQFKESMAPETQGTPSIAYSNWWLVFNDPTLNKLETEADSANQYTRLTVAKVDQPEPRARYP